MKRVISLLLVIATLISMAACFWGCKKEDATPLTMGTWLTMVNQSFGMDTYSEQTPFFSNINEGDPYFAAVQIAAEWGVIDTEQAVDVKKNITWRDTLITLVNAGNFVATDTSDEKKVDYAIEKFDKSIRKYWMDRTISGGKATALLAIAQELWANKTYDTPVSNVNYADDVTDLTQDDELLYTVEADGTVVLAVSDQVHIEPGEVYLLPVASETGPVTAYRAEKVSVDGDKIYIKNSNEELQLEDVYEELFVQETAEVRMENVTVRDGNGDLVSIGQTIVAQNATVGGGYVVSPLSAKGADTGAVVNLAAPKVSHSFELEDVGTVSFEYSLNGALDFKASIEGELLSKKYRNQHPGQSLKLSASAGISDLKTTYDIDFGIIKGLKSASVRADYKTELETMLEFSGKPVEKLYAPAKQNYTCKEWKDTFAKNWASSVWKDSGAENAKGSKTIKIASVTVYSVGAASLCLDISLEVSVSGSVTLKVTETGAKGLEYKDKKLRTINTCDRDVDFEVKGKIEAVVKAGPMLYALGLKKALLGVEASVGFGAEVSAILHIADSEGHLLSETSLKEVQGELGEMFDDAETTVTAQLIAEIAEMQGCTYESETSGDVIAKMDICFDGKIYFILRLNLAKNTYAGDLINTKKVSWEICGAKNAIIAHLHCCKGDWQGSFLGFGKVECKLEYTPFIKNEEPTETTDSTESTDETMEGVVAESIMLDTFKLNLTSGNSGKISVSALPEGCTINDLVWRSEDETVAKVDSSGVVTAVGNGSTIITVSTKDGFSTAFCAVFVQTKETTAKLTGITYTL